ncbi:MAG: LuxR C-terminal-related transcriptional regulator [Cellulomonadaceae bacterium]|jgi:DNA-binding NarL/FixJ family response regulator|nr:LuxR C-terminal-related transcriptional regulator [Cellulomonadaceae bacterium]
MTSTGTLHVDARDDAIKHLTAGTSVDLLGLPGSGRSVLAKAIATEMSDFGWQIVTITGAPGLRDRPLEALTIAGLVSRQAPQQQQGSTVASTAVSAAVQGLQQAIKPGSTLVVVECSSGIDEVSSGVISVVHSMTPFPILSTSRPAPRTRRPSWQLSANISPGVTIFVPPHGYVDTQTLLVEALGGDIESSAVSRIFAASGGLPALVLALVEIARNHGTLREVQGVWEASPELWTPEMMRAVEPLLHPLSPSAVDALEALALAGTVEVGTARKLMDWETLEELDGYGLLRFVPRGDEMLVGVFPLAIIEYFRHHGIGARHLRVDELLSKALGGSSNDRPAPAAGPWHTSNPTDALQPVRLTLDGSTVGEGDIENRLLLEHWHRELLLRRSEWEASPLPRTAAALIRTLLVTGGDPAEVMTVRQSTPRVGDPRDLVAFDDWYAIFLGIVERDLDQVRAVLAKTRVESDEWVALVDGIEAFLVLLIDSAPDPDSLPDIPVHDESIPLDTREIVAWTRAELLLAQGRSEDALTLIDDCGKATSSFAAGRASARPWALLLEGRLDEALDQAKGLMTAARRENDVEGIVGAAYVAAQVYLSRGRTAELRTLLGSVLSSGIMPPMQRPQHVALLSMAASMAADEGRTTTAKTLSQQALSLQTGPGAFPLGSPTRALAILEAADLQPNAAHQLVAERLWAESVELVSKGYLVSGYVAGMLAVVEEPTAERGKVLTTLSKRIPAPRIRSFDMLVSALCSNDSEAMVTAGHALADAGYVWDATRLYTVALGALRGEGAAARASEVHEDARRRLESWGPEAAVGLRSASEGAELTAREDEIARLAANGLSNQDIAKRLMISVRTVENHLHRVFRKLGVENRAEMSRVLAG